MHRAALRGDGTAPVRTRVALTPAQPARSLERPSTQLNDQAAGDDQRQAEPG